MKLSTIRPLALSALIVALAPLAGCAHEVSHSESDKPGWFGGRTHQETTVYENPDGSTSVSREKKTSNP